MVNYTIKVYWDKMECVELYEFFKTVELVRARTQKIALEGLHVDRGEEGFYIPPHSISHVSFEETVQKDDPCPPSPQYWPWIIVGNLILWIIFLWVFLQTK